MKKIYSNKLFFILVSLLLLAFGVVLSIIFNPYSSLSVLTIGENPSDLKFTNSTTLYKGDKLKGEFLAKENNLGIVYIKFNYYNKPDYLLEDNLVFKIKEKGAKTWFAVNHYKSGIIDSNLFFPFGFPKIANSKGKTYDFELQSLNGNAINAVSIDLNNFAFASGYQVPKSEILASKYNFLDFMRKKILYSYENIYFIFSSILYFLPAFFYIFWNTVLARFIAHKYILATVSLILMTADFIYLRDVYSGILLGVLGLWIISIWIYKLKSDVSLAIFLIVVLGSVILIQFHGNVYLINKLSVWAYFFLAIGIFEKIVFFDKEARMVNIKDFIKGLFKFL